MNRLEKILIGASLVGVSLLGTSLDHRLNSFNTVYAQEQRSERMAIIKGSFSDIYSKENAGVFAEMKNGDEIAINIVTDLNYDEHLRIVNNNKNRVNIIHLKEFFQNYEAGEKFKFTPNGHDYKLWFEYENGREQFYLSSKNLKRKYLKGFSTTDLTALNKLAGIGKFIDLHDKTLSFNLEQLRLSRTDVIHKDGVHFSPLGEFSQIKEPMDRLAHLSFKFEMIGYVIGTQGNLDKEGHVSLTFWNRFKLEGMAEKPVAVTYLGLEKPGSTSTPFSLGGKFYHIVYNAESNLDGWSKWELEELK